jgi:hypothetical protein
LLRLHGITSLQDELNGELKVESRFKEMTVKSLCCDVRKQIMRTAMKLYGVHIGREKKPKAKEIYNKMPIFDTS